MLSRFYRLRVPLPIRVDFPSCWFLIEIEDGGPAMRFYLKARIRGEHSYHLLGPMDYQYREAVEAAAFQFGVPVAAGTVGAMIIRRLVREGRAELVPPPADNPLHWRRGGVRCLGAWVRVDGLPTVSR